VIVPRDPLPDCLTRLLDEPAARSFAPTPGDRTRSEADRATRPSGERLDGAVLRGVVIAGAGLVWAVILWLVLRHFLA
jgi:hypothetical protein